ncbi:hypothetical protein M5689_017843 [Euphorbia peplus]|nr:hypothetical protein M5689_017843 [Euphorbia peplus]
MQSINVRSWSVSFPRIEQNRPFPNPNFVRSHRLDIIGASSKLQDGLQSSTKDGFHRRSWCSPAIDRQWNTLSPNVSEPKFDSLRYKQFLKSDRRPRSFAITLMLVLLQLLFHISHSIGNSVKLVPAILNPVSLLSFFKQKLASRRELMMQNKFEEWVRQSGEDQSIVNEFEEWIIDLGRVYKDANEKQKRYLFFKETLKLIHSFQNGEHHDHMLFLSHFADRDNDEDIDGYIYSDWLEGTSP